jgi:hypothetical protein
MAMKLNDDLNATRGVTTFRIPLDKVKEKPGFNTRFGPPRTEAYQRLKDLIRVEGQRVPIEVWLQPDPQGRTALCIPFQGNEQDAKIRSITANIGQTGLSVMDNVTNWNYLINVVGKPIGTKDDPNSVAGLYKVSPATITEGLKLLQLDRKHQKLVHEGKLSQSMALRLVKYPADKRDTILDEMERVFNERIARAEEAVDEVETGEYTEAPAPENVVTMPPPVAGPIPVPPPEPAPEPTPQPKPRTRTVKSPTETDLLKAAEIAGVQTGDEPPRKLKEFNTYLDAFLEQTPKCPATELVRELKKYLARKLTDEQMDNRLMKFTNSVIGEVLSDPKKDKRGGKK